MGLLGSITKVQNLGVQFYTELAQVFSANSLIRETWICMAQDLQQQVAGLQALPHSFWNQIKDEEDALLEATRACSDVRQGDTGQPATLGHSLSRSLDFEEPLILKIYVPLIRRLRTGGSGQVLDLYIMLKAHVSRLLQVVQSYSGDPASIQRVSSLFQSFEKGVQVPEEPVVHGHVAAHARNPKKARQVQQKPRPARHSLPVGKRSIRKPRKPLIKVSRRAQR